MKYYGKITDPKDLVTKEYTDSKQAKVTASGILKGDGNGNVSAATAGTDYVTPAQFLALGLTGASVGDLVRVNSVDANGKPTSWRKAPLCEIRTNPNLLDNWYFLNAVNQRGQESYLNEEYCIDRWSKGTNGAINSIGPTYGLLVTPGTAIIQAFESGLKSSLNNKVCTLSVAITSGTFLTVYYGTFTYQTAPSATINVFNNSNMKGEIGTDGKLYITWQASFNNGIAAVKLEFGSEQTIAHQENGQWVLNEIPDYWEELAKCQTSRADSSDTYANQEIAIINRNPGAHNSIYRGKYLGSAVTTEQYAAINAGTFDDLYIGDYWTINNVNWRIAAFDYWLRTGDKNWNDGNGNYTVSYESTHHIVIVPDTNLYNAQMHNTESGAYTEGAANNPTTGAYIGSDMYTTNLARAKTIVNDAFGAAHVLNHREHLQNAATNGYSTGGAWYDSTVDLMNEQMVYGCRVFGNVLNGTNWTNLYTNSKSQLPLFALEPSRICNRAPWWLRDVASSTNFAYVYSAGHAAAANSSNSAGVRPAFGIKA